MTLVDFTLGLFIATANLVKSWSDRACETMPTEQLGAVGLTLKSRFILPIVAGHSVSDVI